MSSKIINHDNQTISDLVAQAHALRIAVIHEAVSYEEAKVKAEAILQKVNEAGKRIARKYRRRYKKIRFSDL